MDRSRELAAATTSDQGLAAGTTAAADRGHARPRAHRGRAPCLRPADVLEERVALLERPQHRRARRLVAGADRHRRARRARRRPRRLEPLVRDPGRDDPRASSSPARGRADASVRSSRRSGPEHRGARPRRRRGVRPRAVVVAGHQPAPDHRDRPAQLPAAPPPARVVLVCGTPGAGPRASSSRPSISAGEPRRPGRTRETREPEVAARSVGPARPRPAARAPPRPM